MTDNKQNKKNDAWANRLFESYEDWGQYMDYKKAKLEDQYKEQAAIDFKEASSLFKGIAIFVNGYTNPPSDELRRLMMAHGGIFHHYLHTGVTTHIIATNLPYSKIVMYKKAQNPLPLCKPEWIIDSIKAGKVLDYRKYLLYSQHTKTQPKLANIFEKQKKSDSSRNDKNTSEEAFSKTRYKERTTENKKIDIMTSTQMVNETNDNFSFSSILEKPQSTVIEETKEEVFEPKNYKENVMDNRNKKTTIITSAQNPLTQKTLNEANENIASLSIFEKSQSTMIEEKKEMTFETGKYKEKMRDNRDKNVTVNTSTQKPLTQKTLNEANENIKFSSIFEKPQSTMIEERQYKEKIMEKKEKVTDDPSSIKLTSTERNCTKNSEFLTEFYNNSRLHHISTMGAMFKDYINDLRDKSTGEFPGLKKLCVYRKINEAGPSSRHDSDSDEDMFRSDELKFKKENIVMHIDMDCFFVSVGLRNQPELRGFPIAVAHAKGNKTTKNYEELGSMSEIASCSYEARKAGVKNGMFLGQALKLCPNLKTIRYDFEGYKEVSYALYDSVASYTLQIEAVSCDEMYVDCSELLQRSGLCSMTFAEILRKEIREKTGCPVSTGFGSNKLQARLATKKAKPDGQFHLQRQDVETYLRTLAVKDLPGVGYTTAAKLKQTGINDCSDLQRISLFKLQRDFGKKTGELLYNMCRGIDNSKLNLEHIRKSVSAEVNYGIRFENENDATSFLEKLCIEICNRLKKANSIGRNITLKLMVRSKEAPKETAKFMGHGLCDYFTKTKNLMTAVDDNFIITKEVLSLWHQMQQIPEEIRGIGIQISRLESTKNKTTNSSTLLNFINKIKEVSKESIPSTSTNSLACVQVLSSNIENMKNQNHSQEVKLKVPLSEEANSNPIIKKTQTKPEDFFKKTKPSVSRSEKVQLPSLQEIDMAVLIELPEDIRNEILNEYKLKNNSEPSTSRETIIEKQSVPKKSIVNKHLQRVSEFEKNGEADISFSQVDPDFLAALTEDMRNDVEMYCQMKKREKQLNNKTSTATYNKNVLQRNTKAKVNRKRKTDKIGNTKIGNNAGNKKVKIIHDEIVKPIVKKVEKKKEEVQVIEREKVETNNSNNKKQCTIEFENKKFSIDDCKVEENKEILITLVNCMLDLPVEQVKAQIQAWISSSEAINEIDFLSIVTFLGMLPKRKRIEDLHILLKTMHRYVTKLGNCVWHETYKKIAEHIQHNMQLEYNSDLILPPMGCNRCTR